MPMLIIRKVPEDVRSRLRLRAARAGRSAAAEACATLLDCFIRERRREATRE